MTLSESIDLALALLTEGAPIAHLAEALLLAEMGGKELAAIKLHDPQSIVYHPAEPGASQETIDDINQRRRQGENVSRYTDDLPHELRQRFVLPSEGKFSRPKLDVIRAHGSPPQYSDSAKALGRTGKFSIRAAPYISSEHLDLMKHAAKGQAESRTWYEDIHKPLQDIFDSEHFKDSHMVAGLLAAYSPQTHPHPNVHKALRAWRDLIKGRPLVGGPAQVNNAIRAAHGMALSGPKVHWYHRNITHGLAPEVETPTGEKLGSVAHPTNDRHMKYAFLRKYDDNIEPEEHVAITQATRHVAAKLKWPQHHTQAAVWTHDIRAGGLNDPAFHQARSPFKHLSTKYGGYLPPTETKAPVQDYGQFLRANEGPLREIKRHMDEYRLNHPHYRDHAGKATPFLFHPAVLRGPGMKYGKEVTDLDLGDVKSRHGAVVDLKSRDLHKSDVETGWPVKSTPAVYGGTQKPTQLPHRNFLQLSRRDLKGPTPF